MPNGSIGITTVVDLPFDEAVTKTREALADQGFGVLTEIDVKATLKTKIDKDIENYLILGACRPPLAYEAVLADPQIGLLLPCNVVVRDSRDREGAVVVEAMNPDLMVDVSGKAALGPIASDAGVRLRAALSALSGTTVS
ncbi:DUF302 domain-containing protein [Hoyosella subflava]|uniref:DUF302 domain-containing protein n=1 Tax=Hoyosella subflava (strain DSM 45089 / JCM 17490 / NBRC 109087 / DQS3-9A1) TaxID=443218 RepID=F6ERA4_HOYSD|nr:DUF302 domain-containing protein [Hoyosella subflava]AEF41982.1 hypothetical protein AS9A_3544 [Hoyosella subflava DQS3-9A1]